MKCQNLFSLKKKKNNNNNKLSAAVVTGALKVKKDATIYPFMPNGLYYHNSFDRSISNRRGVWLIITMFYRNSRI